MGRCFTLHIVKFTDFHESQSSSNYIQFRGSVFLLLRGRVSFLQQEVLR